MLEGCSLTTSLNTVFELITDQGMLQCNQNGVTGKLVKRGMNYSLYDIWDKLTCHLKTKL